MQFASYRNLRGDEIALVGDGLGFSLNPISAVKSVGSAVASGAGAVYSGVKSIGSGVFSVGGTVVSAMRSIPSSAVFLGKLAVKIPGVAIKGVAAITCPIVNSSAGQVASVVASATPQGAVGSTAARAVCGSKAPPPPPPPGSLPPAGPLPGPQYDPYSGGYGPPMAPAKLPFFRASNPVIWLGALGVIAGTVAVARKRR